MLHFQLLYVATELRMTPRMAAKKTAKTAKAASKGTGLSNAENKVFRTGGLVTTAGGAEEQREKGRERPLV